MGNALATKLQELLSVDTSELSIMERAQHMAELERAQNQLGAVVLDELADFEESKAWRLDASYSVGNWLTGHVGTSKSDARRQTNLARHLRKMPATAAALRAGHITLEHARVLARAVANPRTSAAFAWSEHELVGKGRRMSADELANEVASFIERVDQDGPEPKDPEPDVLYANRVGDRVKIDGDFGLETGLPLLGAINERNDQLFRRDQKVTDANPEDTLAHRMPAERRAEALVELVMAGSGAGSNPARREPLFNIHMDFETFAELRLREGSMHELDDGSVIPVRTLDVLRCEGRVARVLRDAQDVMLSYGREERYANRELRRALAARDRGCAVPGCDRPPSQCDAHHIVFWENWGTTDIDNLVLLCRHHHRMVHTGRLSVAMVDGHPRFYDSIGNLLEKGRWRPKDHAA